MKSASVIYWINYFERVNENLTVDVSAVLRMRIQLGCGRKRQKSAIRGRLQIG